MMNLSGNTQPFAVLGHPIGHTLSPRMHNASFAALGLDAVYLALDVNPRDLMEVLPAMAKMGFRGVNLTIPLKETAFHGLKNLAPSAALLGAVNTVEFSGTDGLIGHNTDGEGFLEALQESFGRGVTGDSIFLLGAGGAGRAVALSAASAGARRIVLGDLDLDRVVRLQEELNDLNVDAEIAAAETEKERIAAASDADLVIQATPLGMKKSDPSPLPSAAFGQGQRVFDLIYMHPETTLMRTARQAGASTSNGLGMLLHQGARAFEIWTATKPSLDAMRQTLEKAVYSK